MIYDHEQESVEDFVQVQELSYGRASAVKYLCRPGRELDEEKIEDLQKAISLLEVELTGLQDRQPTREEPVPIGVQTAGAELELPALCAPGACQCPTATAGGPGSRICWLVQCDIHEEQPKRGRCACSCHA